MRHSPRPFCVTSPDGPSLIDAESLQIAFARVATLPFLPAAASEPPPQPLVELLERARSFGQSEVAQPAHQVAIELGDAFSHGDSPVASGVLTQDRFDARQTLAVDTQLDARAEVEGEAEVGTFPRPVHRALLKEPKAASPLVAAIWVTQP